MRSLSSMLAALAALLLAAPAATPGAGAAAKLRVSATVVRSMEVSVSADASGGALRIRTAGGEAWSASLASAAASGLALARHAEDARYVVVTVLADAPAVEATAR